MSAALDMKLVVFLLILCAGGSAVTAAVKPNVALFLADDPGQRDLGCYGSTFHDTPNLDRLAKSGMKFTQAYAACPVCPRMPAVPQTRDASR